MHPCTAFEVDRRIVPTTLAADGMKFSLIAPRSIWGCPTLSSYGNHGSRRHESRPVRAAYSLVCFWWHGCFWSRRICSSFYRSNRGVPSTSRTSAITPASRDRVVTPVVVYFLHNLLYLHLKKASDARIQQDAKDSRPGADITRTSAVDITRTFPVRLSGSPFFEKNSHVVLQHFLIKSNNNS